MKDNFLQYFAVRCGKKECGEKFPNCYLRGLLMAIQRDYGEAHALGYLGLLFSSRLSLI